MPKSVTPVDNPFAAEVDDVLITVEPNAMPKASSYGCGSDECQNCYPVFYRCEHGIDFPKPIINNAAGRAVDMESCEHHDLIED